MGLMIPLRRQRKHEEARHVLVPRLRLDLGSKSPWDRDPVPSAPGAHGNRDVLSSSNRVGTGRSARRAREPCLEQDLAVRNIVDADIAVPVANDDQTAG